MARTETALTLLATSIVYEAPRLVYSRDAAEQAELLDPYTRAPYLEANSQEFKAGDMVYLNAGAVTQALTATAAPIVGFALTNATNVTSGNAQIRIAPIRPGQVWEISPWTATSNGTNTNPPDLALLVGKMVNLRQIVCTQYDASTTYCTAADIDTVTMARALIVGIAQRPENLVATATYARLLVTFPDGCIVSTDGASYYQNLQLG
jgi:hypothetical protein